MIGSAVEPALVDLAKSVIERCVANGADRNAWQMLDGVCASMTSVGPPLPNFRLERV